MVCTHRRREARLFVAMGAVIVLLVFLTSWSFRAGSIIAGSFQVDDLLICEELSGDMRPLPDRGDLKEGVKQVCLWFSYSGARKGDMLELSWQYGGETIQKELFRLDNPGGVRAFYLLREDGSPLPTGDYAAALLCNGRKKTTEIFYIRPDGWIGEDENGVTASKDITPEDSRE